MPQMGGAKLAAQLASDRPEMKVLFVSGYAETTFQRHGEIDVTTRFLQKPFSLKALARKIREVLDAEEQPQLHRDNPARGACPI
jgi:two-component system cell cycle sensor histidine kinase/response regulator CckA